MKARQREYETVYLLRPDLNDEERETVRNRLTDAIEEASGHVLKSDDWGLRDTAYEIHDEASGQSFERARYQYVRYLVPSQKATVVDDQLKLVEENLKSLTVKIDDDLIPEERLNEPVEKGGEGGEETLPYSD